MARPGRARAAGRVVGFEAQCTWCGVNFPSLSISDLEAPVLAGVHPVGWRAPFELLEHRSGPPIRWDDLIGFHRALAQAENGAEVTRVDGRSGPGAFERDAA